MKLIQAMKTKVALCLVGILIGCATSDPSIKDSIKSSTYEKQLSNVLVVVDFAHLEKAFAEDGDTPGGTEASKKQATINARVVSRKLSATVAEKLTTLGVQAGQAIYASGEDKSTLSRIVAQGRRPQILLFNTAQFQTTTTTNNRTFVTTYNGWNGQLSWDVSLYDLDQKNNPVVGKPVWKIQTDLFRFGLSVCLKDQYKECTEKLTAVIIDQLKKDGLISAQNITK